MKKNVKYFISDGTEISEGDTVTITNKKVTENGFTITEKSIKVTEDTIPYLVDNEIITVKKEVGKDDGEVNNEKAEFASDPNCDEITLDNVIEFIAEGMQWRQEKVIEFMIDTYFMSPIALYDLIYEYTNCFLECTKYENELIDSCKMYYIEPLDHIVKPVGNSHDSKNKYVTAFRAKEDAMIAIKIGEEAINAVEDAIVNATEE